MLGFMRRFGSRNSQRRETDFLIATIIVVFVLATLKSIADVAGCPARTLLFACLCVAMPIAVGRG